MPSEVINRVNNMARRNQAQRDIAFFYSDGLTPVASLANDDYAELAGVEDTDHAEDDDDEIYVPEGDDEDDNTNDSESDSDNDNDDDSDVNDEVLLPVANDRNEQDPVNHEPASDEIINETQAPPDKSNEGPIPDEITSESDTQEQVQFTRHDQPKPIDTKSDILPQQAFEKETDELYGTRQRDGLRNRKPVDYPTNCSLLILSHPWRIRDPGPCNESSSDDAI